MSRFLGTLKRYVPLTYVSWEHVPTTLKETLWDYAKARAEKNSKSRRQFTNTHIVGPKLFSQVRHDMGKNLAPGQKPCDGQIFIKTRKRNPDRQYKINPDVINFRIKTLEKKLNSSEELDGVDELISGGKKSHAPGWLIGRHDTKTVKKATSTASSNQYLQDLTNKIKENCDEEMEAKIEKINQKNQENLALVLKRLADANPGLKIDLDQICGATSSETRANGTPLTGGPTIRGLIAFVIQVLVKFKL
ncbi:hypothetical protein AgCh_006059 [Apium graveolens]